MSYENSVSDHYTHGNLLEAIEAALPALGKTTANLTADDLAPVDEFHIGGRPATDHLMGQLGFSEQDHLLDVGCGLGGAARHMASKYKNFVTGIDLTLEYIETGQALCRWLGLEKLVTLKQGSALDMPFSDQAFGGAYMLHVGMNIADKRALFAEVYRVLKPGSSFGVYDVMRQNTGEMSYPVPWASTSATCALATPEEYKESLQGAGFVISEESSRGDFALEFFDQLRQKTKAKGGPPPLSLHTLMQASTAEKIKNMVGNLTNGCIAPVEIIAQKK
ncbi:MAG: ubiquinone/menaquinone biosynthesis C-methylase UbiE [Candidatus Krumholzibacteriia bacterium]|jgi:ubiquinone/menaquinone biosynthesis C-methylase UbiE